MALNKYLPVLFLILAGLIMPADLRAQGMMDPVQFTLQQVPDTVTIGSPFKVRVRADIEGAWHLYSVKLDPDKGPFPTEFSAESEGLSINGTISESKPQTAYDPNFDTELGWHSKRARFTIPLIFSSDTSKSQALIDLAVHYQVCNDKVCLPPTTKRLTQQVAISEAKVSADEDKSKKQAAANRDDATKISEQSGNESPKQQGRISAAASVGNYGSRGLLSFLWIAITAGFAALLTPCVFPMLPLTVSFFTKQSSGSSRRAFWQALFFGVSIVATFTLIGAILAAIIGASGANQFAANPWVNLFIGLILILFGFSLLGMFELRLPHQLTDWLNRKSDEKSGAAGILFMGLTISAVSFSCTAPFVGGVLAATAGGEWFYPIVGMIAFSAAFSTPFIIFAMFPNWLQSMPKSGSWMNVVKVLLGFVELAAAFKFLSNADLVWGWGIISRPLTIAAWIVIFALAGIYALGYLPIGHEEKKSTVSPLRVIIAIPLLTFSIYLIPGLLGSSLGMWDAWLPPKKAADVGVVQSIALNGSGSANHQGGWSRNYKASLQRAREESKPLFIDYTGYTCTNCRAMEANVFPRSSVQKHFEKMVKVRLYTDAPDVGQRNRKLQFNMTGTVALPTYVILGPYTKKVIEQRSGYTETKVFVNFLERGLAEFKQMARSNSKSK